MKSIQVKVKPGARIELLSELEDGTWLAEVKAPPVDGKANEDVIRIIAAHFGVRRSRVSIASGTSGRLKRVRITED